jgi:hypothetical protein
MVIFIVVKAGKMLGGRFTACGLVYHFTNIVNAEK